MVGAQEAEHDTGEQQTRCVANTKTEIAELKRNQTNHQTHDKERAEGQEIGHLTVNRDKADAICHAFYPSRLAADLQHITFVEHDAVVDRHFNLTAYHPVQEAAVIGKV